MEKICARCGKVKNLLSWETLCTHCQLEVALEKTVEEIRSGEETETSGEDHVICPWCGSVMLTDVGYEDFPEIYEEGVHTLVCEDCGNPFLLTTNVSYFYDTERLEKDTERDRNA